MGKSIKVSKQRVNHKKSINDEMNVNSFNYIFILLISMFIIIIPFYRGLYFRENYIPSVIYISGIFVLYILYKFIKRDEKLSISYFDIAVLLLPIIYMISFFVAVNSKDALDEVLKYASYFMIYKMVADLCVTEKKSKLMMEIVLFSILVSTTAAILTVGGVLDLKGVFVSNRFHGAYQYPNTTAAVIGAGLMLAFGLINEGKMRLSSLYYQAVITTLLTAFILTLSRGAFVVFALVFLLYFVITPAQKKLKLIYNAFFSLVVVIPLAMAFYNNFTGIRFILYYIASVLISVVLQFMLFTIEKKYIDRINSRFLSISVVAALVVITLISSVAISYKVPITYNIMHKGDEESSWKVQSLTVKDLIPGTKYKLSFDVKSNMQTNYSYLAIVSSKEADKSDVKLASVNGSVEESYTPVDLDFITPDNVNTVTVALYNREPESYTMYRNIKITDEWGSIVKQFKQYKFIPKVVADRLTDISFSTRNLTERFIFNKDGMKVFSDYFLVGAGGGGWKNIYNKYQSYPYNTKEAHNFYVQMLVETGILGAIAFGFILFMIGKGLYNVIKSDRNDSIIYAFMAALVLLVHSYFDFDLSLSAITFLLWIIIGLIGARSSKKLKMPKENFAKGFASVAAIVVLMTSLSIYMGMLNGRTATSLINSDTNKSVKLYEKAMSQDRFNAAYRMDYAQVMNAMYQNTKNQLYLDNMYNAIDETIKSEGYKFEYVNVIIQLMMRNGRLEEASEIANKLVDYRPMDQNAYLLDISTNYAIAKEYFDSNQHVKATPYLKSIIIASDKLEAAKERSLEPIVVADKIGDMIEIANTWLEVAEKEAGTK